MRNTHVPVGPWRGVNTNQNGLYMECFMDEVARAAGADPLEFRRAPCRTIQASCGAERGGGKAGWGTLCRRASTAALPNSWVGSYPAAVAEVS